MQTPATITARVARKRVEATDICSFELVAADTTALPTFTAGSHIDVHTPGGPTRQYSLCNNPAERHRYLIGVLKDAASRGGSAAMHERLNEGNTLIISTPKNHFPIAPQAARHLLLAGGIGITPILCMAEQLADSGANFEMHYCARSPDRAAFRGHIASSRFASNVHFHYDDGDATQKLDLAAALALPQDDVHLYVCGPQGFMDAVLAMARANGWPEARLHCEFFAAAPVKSDADSAFEVELASSGKVVMVGRDQTVLKALAAAGIELLSSCEQGVCGTCMTRVLAGVPDHRDQYLTPEEQAANDQFLPCCSRARSARLVLDL